MPQEAVSPEAAPSTCRWTGALRPGQLEGAAERQRQGAGSASWRGSAPCHLQRGEHAVTHCPQVPLPRDVGPPGLLQPGRAFRTQQLGSSPPSLSLAGSVLCRLAQGPWEAAEPPAAPSSGPSPPWQLCLPGCGVARSSSAPGTACPQCPGSWARRPPRVPPGTCQSPRKPLTSPRSHLYWVVLQTPGG